MDRNDKISMAWYNASVRNGPSISENTVPALSASDMCESCAAIDLPGILQQSIEEDEGKFITSLGTRDDLQAASCALCRVFGAIAELSTVGEYENHGTYQLRALPGAKFYNYNRHPSLAIDRFDTTVLGVVPDGHHLNSWVMAFDIVKTGLLCPVRADIVSPSFGVRILTESVDTDFVKRCLSHCANEHSLDLACSNNNTSRKRLSTFWKSHRNYPSETFRNISSMQYFRLIDCAERSIVKAQPGMPYVALSYVWGAPKHDNPCASNPSVHWPPVLENLPRTIDDCIEATLSFGLRYLWIDRYCINQQNAKEQHDQVSQMDLIYANAELTIIAATGIGPDCGLPGVNKTKRSPQPVVRIGNIILASTLPNAMWSVKRSSWTTRGWTYQEAILSKRRLIFTTHQTYFECHSMHIAESALMPLHVLHLRGDGPSGELSKGTFDFKVLASNTDSLQHLIAEYSYKLLTYPADRLNAMKGIFMYYAKLKYPVYQLMGVPMIRSDHAAKYYLVKCFLVGLSWSLMLPGTRRPEFPSWTWAGWDGALSYWRLAKSEDVASDIRVSIEDPDGNLSSIPGKRSSMRSHSYQDMQLANTQVDFIHITARSFEFELLPPRWDRVSVYIGDFRSVYYGFNSNQVCTDQGIGAYPRTLTAIIIGNLSSIDLAMIIGVENKGDFVERVGIFQTDRVDYSDEEEERDERARDEQFLEFLRKQPQRTFRLG